MSTIAHVSLFSKEEIAIAKKENRITYYCKACGLRSDKPLPKYDERGYRHEGRRERYLIVEKHPWDERVWERFLQGSL